MGVADEWICMGLTTRRNLEFPGKSRRRHVRLLCNLVWNGIWSDVKKKTVLFCTNVSVWE